MAPVPKPWWRSARKQWYVQIDGVSYKLGPDKDEADREFHRLMAMTPEQRAPKVEAPPATGLTVAELLDKFLCWVEKHRAPRTLDWYKDHLQSFTDALPAPASMLVSDLKPYMVIDWVDLHPTWGSCFRRGAIGAIQTSCRWGVRMGFIPASPIPHLEKPQATRRESVVTQHDWERIRDHYPEGDCFRDLLEVSWESGARPQETRSIEARHVQLAAHRVIFPAKEAKGKKRIRVIHLTPRAEQIIKKLMKLRPKGLLFLNAKGRPWNFASMNCRFGRLKKTLGVKWCAYALRHGFCEKLLESGVDHLTVAQLMGHSTGAMVASTYSHLGQAHDHLQEALKKGAAG
jgi:integrase